MIKTYTNQNTGSFNASFTGTKSELDKELEIMQENSIVSGFKPSWSMTNEEQDEIWCEADGHTE